MLRRGGVLEHTSLRQQGTWERKYGKVPEAVNVSTCADEGESRTFNYTYTRDKDPNPSEHMQKYGMTDIVRLKAVKGETTTAAGNASA